MIERLDDYDWASAFEYATSPAAVPPGASVARDGFDREDVADIAWIENGENDDADWIIGGTLKDGRWFFLAAGCDYTGWGCQEWGNSYVAESREDIERFGMGDGERDRLGIVLHEMAERRTENAGW